MWLRMLNLSRLQDEVLGYFKSKVPQPVYEQGIPDAETVVKVGGKIVPYIALQFGDIQERASGRGFSGVRYNEYDLPIYIQVVAADPKIARKIASESVLDALLGVQFDWAGQVRKRSGGSMWPITNSNGATEAYLAPSSWAITVQLSDQV